MPRLPLIAIALLSASPLAAQDSLAVAPGQAALLGVRYPENVGSFAASRITRYPDPDLGISVSYLAQGLRAEISIYVFPFPADGDDELLRQQFDADWKVLQGYSEQARGMEVTVVGFDSVTVVAADGTPYRGWSGEITMRRQGESHASFLHLFRKDDAFVKFRVSYDRSIRVTIAPEVEAFLAAALARVIPAERPGASTPDGN